MHLHFSRKGFVDRIGSHIEDNYIGIIRQRYHSNNRMDTVFRARARLRFVKSRLPFLGYQSRSPSRANLGGVRITEEGLSIEPVNLSPIQVMQSILLSLGCEIRQMGIVIVPFDEAVQWIIDLAITTPSGPCRFCGDASGSQILTRLMSFRPEASATDVAQANALRRARQTRMWSVGDIERMRDAIGNGAHDRSELEPFFPDRSSSCIQKKFRKLLRFESSRRPWTHETLLCKIISRLLCFSFTSLPELHHSVLMVAIHGMTLCT
jgi:hypothetical protein